MMYKDLYLIDFVVLRLLGWAITPSICVKAPITVRKNEIYRKNTWIIANEGICLETMTLLLGGKIPWTEMCSGSKWFQTCCCPDWFYTCMHTWRGCTHTVCSQKPCFHSDFICQFLLSATSGLQSKRKCLHWEIKKKLSISVTQKC